MKLQKNLLILPAEIFFAPMSCLKALLAPYNTGDSSDKFHQDLSTFVKLKISAFKDKCKKDTQEIVNEQRSRTQKVNPRCLLRRLPVCPRADVAATRALHYRKPGVHSDTGWRVHVKCMGINCINICVLFV